MINEWQHNLLSSINEAWLKQGDVGAFIQKEIGQKQSIVTIVYMMEQKKLKYDITNIKNAQITLKRVANDFKKMDWGVNFAVDDDMTWNQNDAGSIIVGRIMIVGGDSWENTKQIESILNKSRVKVLGR